MFVKKRDGRLAVFNEDKILEFIIRETAAKYNVLLTKSTLSIIKECSSKTTLKSIFRFISDYLYLHSEIKQPISCAELAKIIDML